MGIFTPDFAAVDAGFPLYPKGMYRLKVVKRDPFINESQNQETGEVKVSAGVRYGLEMYGWFNPDLEGEDALQPTGEDGREIRGKAVSRYTVWTHSQGGWAFAKGFLMASCGFNVKNEENEANELLFQEGDWSFNGDPGDEPDDIELGDSWNLPVDRFVDAYLSISTRHNPRNENEPFEDQEFSAWSPVGGRVDL